MPGFDPGVICIYICICIGRSWLSRVNALLKVIFDNFMDCVKNVFYTIVPVLADDCSGKI